MKICIVYTQIYVGENYNTFCSPFGNRDVVEIDFLTAIGSIIRGI